MNNFSDVLLSDLKAEPTEWGDVELDRTADGLIFVVGCPRSGTSLVHTMLLSHPDMTMPAETYFMRLLSQFNDFAQEPGEAGILDEVLQGISDDSYQHKLGLDWDLFRSFVEKAPATWAGIFLAWLTAYRIQQEATRIGEKTPRHYLHFDYLLQHFPKARVLFLLRDPRAVFNSYRKMALGQGSIWNGCRLWLEAEGALRRLLEGPYADRISIVRYEALVESPSDKVQTICAFLNLPFSPSMLEPHKRKDRGFKDCHRGHWKNTLKPIFTSSSEAWRNELNKRQMGMIDFVDAEALEHWGFMPTGHQVIAPALRLRLSKWIYRVTSSLRHRLRRFIKD